METDMTRREVLRSVAKTAAGLTAVNGFTALGANDRVRVAICGLNGRGKDHIHGFSHVPNVEIAALCDIDENLLQKRRAELDGKPQTYVEVRKLLEDRHRARKRPSCRTESTQFLRSQWLVEPRSS